MNFDDWDEVANLVTKNALDLLHEGAVSFDELSERLQKTLKTYSRRTSN